MMDIRELKRRPAAFKRQTRDIELNLDNLAPGLQQTDELLIFDDGERVKIFDRICDHNGGRLFVRDKVASCPLHGWTLNPETSQYMDVKCTKKPLMVVDKHELDSPVICVESAENRRELSGFTRHYETQVEFINHACLLFNVDGLLSFATDPWVVGPAFCNGWWLSRPSPADVFQRLNECDFIYISHNHPDHLHPESLSYLRKDIPILTAPFVSGSTVRYLTSLGFSNILTCGFNEELYSDEQQIAFSVLKSGDFRDDSGLLIQLGRFTALLTVDSNFIDFGRIPEKVDLLCSSFAGGASGFPLCFELYSEQEKARLIQRNRGAIRATNKQAMARCSPDYFLPYAGFFTEAAPRDSYIKRLNNKNSIEDYRSIAAQLDCQLLSVEQANLFRFHGGELQENRWIDYPALQEKPVDQYMQETALSVGEYTREQICQYFMHSGFHGNLVLLLVLCDDEFQVQAEPIGIEFDLRRPPMLMPDAENAKDLATTTGKNYLRIKVRQNEIKSVCQQGLPWEDLSIGFQCSIDREPNIYNSDFWYHFTNIYIHDAVAKVGSINANEDQSCSQ
ncbi:MBL fold metallo-hydrolase [Lacimicrobium alkaliphilum]|uniref:Cytidine monophosphate-N-acetylneuraminic acid hydroxylase n=1 Tax=Lacimicrobium alkaliphilum TaxID=1526571 RepID=A0ABQ1RN42_9ALTE|nr:MBL fold metallo-hydrolase [Lacimicrobium alkaliphilum]GGD72514.1 hypothetical protein GCM10011357_29410 [Lacimicrobium alkaliphilum]